MYERYQTIDAELAAVTGGPPDYITINLGINDCPVTDDSYFTTRLTYIVEKMHAKWSNARIGLMRFWSAGIGVAGVEYANGLVDAIIAAHAYCFTGPDERIFLENGDNGATYTIDGTHPTDAGYTLTAIQWRTTIEAIQ